MNDTLVVSPTPEEMQQQTGAFDTCVNPVASVFQTFEHFPVTRCKLVNT